MTSWTLYYNPRCGTCRKALALLNEHKINPRVVEYLTTPPSEAELDDLLTKLAMSPEEVVRTKEPLYTELQGSGLPSTRNAWIKTLCANPVLIERPIVVRDNCAIVARPPERINELL